ncbi:hypothetical protein WME99_35825 [Sorangium sp. So ce136]|uniref:hypothetical protein n=1 Tax=Sorangium sp. So ce136 TaxID=3133284 RepID=UPI003F0050E6
MTASERDRLRSEAAAMKLRAMRLRMLGDEQDRWEAIVLLHRAAWNELAAVEEPARRSEQEEASARIEACGLFLEASDPIRAAEQCSRLPLWVLTSDAGVAMLSGFRSKYQTQSTNFLTGWRALQHTPGDVPAVHRMPETKLRSMLAEHAGVAELWWALSKRTSNNDEAQFARARMKQLDPKLEDESMAQAAWARLEQAFVSKLKLEMRSERTNNALSLDLVSRISVAFNQLLESFVQNVFYGAVALVPRGARPGSFIIEVDAQELPPHALEELDRMFTSAPERIGARKILHLLNILQQNGVSLRVQIADNAGGSEARGFILDARRRRLLLKPTEAAALRTIESVDIPQANNLDRVFQIVQLIAGGDEVDAEVLEIEPRQVAYYRRAAKILGFLTESEELTAAGRLIARLASGDRLRAAVVHFESSVCGDAWIQWSKGRTLLDVKPETAAEFIIASVPGLSEDTARRRAQTLNAWYHALIVHHYAR